MEDAPVTPDPEAIPGNVSCPYHGMHGLYQGRDCYYCIVEGRIPVKQPTTSTDTVPPEPPPTT
jgi:hypothetical protein